LYAAAAAILFAALSGITAHLCFRGGFKELL
jgi:hypothetical protein